MTELTSDALNAIMPMGVTLDLKLTEAAPGRVVGTMAWAEGLTTAGGALHGGALMALADSIGGAVAFLNLPDGAGTSTISSSTVFIRGVREGVVTATGLLVHKGRSTIVVETEVRDEQGRPVSRTTQSQAVLQPRS